MLSCDYDNELTGNVLARFEAEQTGIMTYLRTILNSIASFVCHQNPSRTIRVHSRLLPLCARCTGIYVSFAFVLLCLMLIPRTRRWLLSRPAEAFPGMFMLGTGLAATVAETKDIITLPLNARLFVGALMGAGLALILFPILNQLVLHRENGNKAHIPAIILSVCWFGILGLLTILSSPAVYYVLYAGSIAGIAGLYLVTNLNVAALMIGNERSKTSNAELVNLFALTLILILAEVLIISFLRAT